MENQEMKTDTTDAIPAVPPPAFCSACDGEGLRLGPVGARAPEWVCDTCGGSGINDKIPPCMECGAMTPEEAETRCVCSGDKDHCHGCDLWQNVQSEPRSQQKNT